MIANIAAIGECVIKIMDNFPDFVADHPGIAWKDIRSTRNRIAHQYFQIDRETIWVATRRDLPELIAELESLRHWRAEGE